jgi:hypothetical protein
LLPASTLAGGIPADVLEKGSLTLRDFMLLLPAGLRHLIEGGSASSAAFHQVNAVYVGVVPLFLCLTLFWFFIRESRARFGLGMILMGGLFAFGTQTPFFLWARRLLPGFIWLEVPENFLLLVDFGFAVVAASGVDFLLGKLQDSPRFSSRLPVAEIVGLVLLLSTAIDFGHSASEGLTWIDRAELFQKDVLVQKYSQLFY